MSQKTGMNVEQNLLQGFDLHMVQQVHTLPGFLFSEFVLEYSRLHRGLKARAFTLSKGGGDQLDYVKKESLYEHLAFQIQVSFDASEKKEALEIAASLDKNGFYDGTITPVVEKMWHLDPVGIATASVQKSLFVQLKNLKQEHLLAANILEHGYRYFLHKDLKKIAHIEKVSIDEVEKAFSVIKTLNPFPGRVFQESYVHYITPEMILSFDKKWKLEFVKECYPTVRIVHKGSPKEIADAKRFIHQLHQRKNRLEWIVSIIVKEQGSFLLGEGEKKNLTRKRILEGLNISESTLSRILSEKYIQTPMGLFPLGYFFSRPTATPFVDQSVENAKKILKKLIDQEDKKAPYPDEILKTLLRHQGIICSRRTIAKYRKGLNISGAYHRTCK